MIVILVFVAGVITENRIHLLQDVVNSGPELIVPVKSFIQRLVHKGMQVLSVAAVVLPFSGLPRLTRRQQSQA